ncbi:MAG: hypothetical protein HY774_29215 [Acidobacteria bacterium]|nr:hypothetical protein [Acidobacteriota bacterium]
MPSKILLFPLLIILGIILFGGVVFAWEKPSNPEENIQSKPVQDQSPSITGNPGNSEQPSQDIIETKIRELIAAKKNAIIVVKGIDNVYWAFYTSRIERIEKNKLKLKKNSQVTISASESSSEKIATALIDGLVTGGGGYGFSLGGNTDAIGFQSGQAKKDTVIEVKEIIRVKPKEP